MNDDLAANIKNWGKEIGFAQVGITDIDVNEAAKRLNKWLQLKYHGDMDYVQKHELQRGDPAILLAKVKSIISCALNYFNSDENINCDGEWYIARYALGRDYHKVMRNYLEQLVHKMMSVIGNFNYRIFVDSAPVLEKPLAVKAGLGWQGKNSLIINRDYGSWIVIGEIFTDLELPIDKPHNSFCGNCAACIAACPTKALSSEYTLNANLCISYLTIEYKGSIPIELRPLIGNRIYGCDACQLACPMNKCAKQTIESNFLPRKEFKYTKLIEFFNWSEEEFLAKTAGSAIRRIGYERWLRNVAIVLGNSDYDPEIVGVLRAKQNHKSLLVREHVNWGIEQLSKAHSGYGRGH